MSLWNLCFEELRVPVLQKDDDVLESVPRSQGPETTPTHSGITPVATKLLVTHLRLSPVGGKGGLWTPRYCRVGSVREHLGCLLPNRGPVQYPVPGPGREDPVNLGFSETDSDPERRKTVPVRTHPRTTGPRVLSKVYTPRNILVLLMVGEPG